MSQMQRQLNLFESTSLNTTYDIKREIRLAMSRSGLSRDQIVDQINDLAVKEGMRKSISKAALDNWSKDSDPDRLPSPAWLTLFCKVVGSVTPISALIRPLDAEIISRDDIRLLMWARAERDKKKATKRARLAEQSLDI
jgi:hypothetical protein